MSNDIMIPKKIADRIETIERQLAELRREDERDDGIIREGNYILREAYDRIRATEPLILEAQNRIEERGKQQAALQEKVDLFKEFAEAFYDEFAARLANADPVNPEPAPVAANFLSHFEQIMADLGKNKKFAARHHNAARREETNSQAIIRVLSEANRPLSARQIAEHGSLVVGSVNTTLTRLRKQRLVDRGAPGLWMIR